MTEEIKNADLIRFVLDGGEVDQVQYRQSSPNSDWRSLTGSRQYAVAFLARVSYWEFRRKPERKPTDVRWIGVHQRGEPGDCTYVLKPSGFHKAIRIEYDPNDDTVKATVEEA